MFSLRISVLILRASSYAGLLAAFAAAFGFVATASHLPAQARHLKKIQPSIDVIKQVLDKDGLYTRTTTSTGGTYKSVTERRFSLKSASGCQLVVTSDAHTHTEMPAQKRVIDRSWTDIYRPDFSVLDVATITVQEPQPPEPTWEAKGYLVRIGVETGKAPIVASSVNKETNKQHDLPGMPNLAVYVASREQADRLAKAFTQVATACHAAK